MVPAAGLALICSPQLQPCGPMADKPLLTLDEHNAMVAEQYHDPLANLPTRCGIACPSCGKELYDCTPNMIMPTSPPRKKVRCHCGWNGSRLA